MTIRAIIDVAWQDRHQAWEGYAEVQVGHVCDCANCGRTGLKVQGVVSTGRNKREAFELACLSIQVFLSAIQGVPMSIITQPGSSEVEYVEDPTAERETGEEYEDEYDEDDLVYSR